DRFSGSVRSTVRLRQQTKIVRHLELGTRRPLRRETPPHSADGLFDGSSQREHGQSSETGPCSHEVGKTMFGGECYQLLGSFRKDRAVAAKLVKDTIDVQSKRQCIRLRQLARPSQGALALRQRLIRLS